MMKASWRFLLAAAPALLLASEAQAGRVEVFETHECILNWGDDTWSLMRQVWIREQRPGPGFETRLLTEEELYTFDTEAECTEALPSEETR